MVSDGQSTQHSFQVLVLTFRDVLLVHCGMVSLLWLHAHIIQACPQVSTDLHATISSPLARKSPTQWLRSSRFKCCIMYSVRSMYLLGLMLCSARFCPRLVSLHTRGSAASRHRVITNAYCVVASTFPYSFTQHVHSHFQTVYPTAESRNTPFPR